MANRKLMWVEYGDDEELSQSRKSPGKQSPLTRDSDGDLHHVVLDDVSDDDLAEFGSGTSPDDSDYWVHDGDDERTREQDIENFVVVLTFLVEVVGPKVNSWWQQGGRDSARAAAQSAKERLARLRRRRRKPDIESGTVIDTAEPTVEPNGPMLSVNEASRMLQDALTAAAFAQHQMDVLRNAVIVDDGTSPELADALQRLGPGNVDEVIAMLREADPEALSEMVMATRPRPLPMRAELPAQQQRNER